MSPMSPPTEPTTSDRNSNNVRELKALPGSKDIKASDRTMNKIARLLNPFWRQKFTLSAKVILFLLVISALPILATNIVFEYFLERSQSQTSIPVEPAPAGTERAVTSTPPRQLPMLLIVEMVVAALLLIGLVAAFLANRAMRTPELTATDDEQTPPHQSTSIQLIERVQFAGDRTTSEQTETPSEQAQLLKEIVLRMGDAICLEDLMKTTVKEVRRAIKSDRVIILGFDINNWDAVVVAESVAPSLPQTIKVKIEDPCFREHHVERYKSGQVSFINNIYQEPRVTECYRNMLEQFAVKANLAAPILRNNELIGLLIAHQCLAPRIWQNTEIDLFAQLANQVGFAVDKVSFLEEQEAEAERLKLITDITLRIHECTTIEDIIKTSVKEIRRAIKSDRVIVFGLDPTASSGIVLAESVAPNLPQTLKMKITDPCLRNECLEIYQSGQVTLNNDIYKSPRVTDCYRRMLEQFAVKANLVAPILRKNELIGLLITHQCSEARIWQKPEIDMYLQLASQIGLAIDRVSLLDESERFL